MNEINAMQVLDYVLAVSLPLAIGYGMYRFAKYSTDCKNKEIKKEHSINDLEIKVLPSILP